LASPASAIYGAGFYEQRFPIKLAASSVFNLRLGVVTNNGTGGIFDLTKVGAPSVSVASSPTGMGVSFRITTVTTPPEEGNYELVFSAFDPQPEPNAFDFTVDCAAATDTPCLLETGSDSKRFRITGYVDGQFDVSGCGAGVSVNPAWDGTFPDWIGSMPDFGDWEADGANAPTNFSISGVVLAEGSVFFNQCEPGMNTVAQAIWEITIWVDNSFITAWDGFKTTGNTAAGVYQRSSGCTVGPATLTLEEY
jgi:hypothetical protein